MPNTKLRVGIAGLGRMGKRHATNFHHLTPRAIVVAVSTPDATERQWAESNLEGTTVYQEFEDMLEQEALDAVVVASATSVHARQALAAIAKGCHVLCEKPLSIAFRVAVGVTAVHPELNAMNDRDNALATVEFDGGKVASLFCSRMMAAGQEDATEIICERGSFRVNVDGRKDFIELHDSYGARQASEFTACCLDGAPTPVSLESSVRAIQIAEALQRSLTSGKKIVFDSNGDEKAERMERL
ncbi:hypothetical protein KC316_g781 [Hortaea werneckii]|nr:hypothetical protein KC324_g848 [Hortaea werneckii]KAI7595044.1 hypothetical protein KC316_g781 [Hortaea werneckii]